ncbi:hypothetical protein [Streptomyces gilvus]|nr:hypothetical protein [Streptomyces sp. CME 23]MCH5677855.1 hypothetical protein [Streptomyces sp. CME 23]
MYRTWLLLSAVLLAVVLALAGSCGHPAAGAVPTPSPNPSPLAPAR